MGSMMMHLISGTDLSERDEVANQQVQEQRMQ
jgi:hypothetical protein